MIKIRIITVGGLSESHWKAACDEYKKRLGGSHAVTEVCLKEAKLPSSPSPAQIKAALDAEGERILENIPARSCVFAMCIEGRQYSSGELAALFEKKLLSGASELCFIVGSSYGLSEKVKAAADVRLSMSELTFPHQLARVMLYETIYRCAEINKGTKYHK